MVVVGRLDMWESGNNEKENLVGVLQEKFIFYKLIIVLTVLLPKLMSPFVCLLGNLFRFVVVEPGPLGSRSLLAALVRQCWTCSLQC